MTMTATAPATSIGPTKIRAIAFASWHDHRMVRLLIYATAGALIFNNAFFPSFDPLAGTLAALASVAVGFLARPLGGS